MSQQTLALEFDFDACTDEVRIEAEPKAKTEPEQEQEEYTEHKTEIPLQHEVVPRATIAAMVRERNATLETFDGAWELTGQAITAIHAAWAKAEEATQCEEISYGNRSGQDAPMEAKRKEEERYRKQIQRTIDSAMWRRIVTMTKLETVMDSTAKDELRSQLQTDPPEITEENIQATIENFMGQTRMIFMRGIATCFSNLDRRFRSHLGFRVGKRIILDNAFNEHGTWGYGRWGQQKRDTLVDIDRTFHVLDGRKNYAVYMGIVGIVDEERHPGKMWNAKQSEIESDYFKINIFKNGNAHIWFKRNDLVQKVNDLLAEYYGETLADATNQRREDAKGRERGKSKAMAKNFGFFPTPEPVAKCAIDKASIYRRQGEEPMTLLEPSAGTGALARLAVKAGATVDCIEIQPEMSERLRAQGVYRTVTTGDFLEQSPGHNRRYDRIVMNPPFDNGLDIEHVRHAMSFLKSNGRLVAIMAAGCEFQETHNAKAFRKDIERLKGQWVDIPAGSFREVGTNVNTVMIVVNADASRSGWGVERW